MQAGLVQNYAAIIIKNNMLETNGVYVQQLMSGNSKRTEVSISPKVDKGLLDILSISQIPDLRRLYGTFRKQMKLSILINTICLVFTLLFHRTI